MLNIQLEIQFCPDGDFYLLAFDNSQLIEIDSSLYKGCVEELTCGPGECNDYLVHAVCRGDEYGCKYAIRDILEILLCEGIRCNNYHVLYSLYKLLSDPLEGWLWSKDDHYQCYYKEIGGNYDGTHIWIYRNYFEDKVNNAKETNCKQEN